MLVIAGGFLLHLSLGTFYTFANIAPYIVSYIRNQSHPSDLNQTTTSWIYACAVSGMGCTAFFGGWLTNKIGPRFTALLGGWIMSAGVILTSFAIKVSFWIVLLTYGIMFGVGMGIAYTAPLAAAMRWMPKWKGVANGIVVSGFGLGALVFNPVQTLYINPHNIPSDPDPFGNIEKYFTDPDLIERVPNLFLILGVTFAVMQLIGSLLITNPPGYLTETSTNKEDIDTVQAKVQEVDDIQLLQCCEPNRNHIMTQTEKDVPSPPESTKVIKSPGTHSPVQKQHNQDGGNDPGTKSSNSEKQHLLQENQGTDEKPTDHSHNEGPYLRRLVMMSLNPLEILRRPYFYVLWIMFLCNGIAVMFTSSLYKFFGNSFIDDDHYLAIVGSISSIFNCLGRISWGVVADHTSYRFAIILLSATMTVFTLTFYSCVLGGEAMFFVWVCIIFFCIGGNYSVFPMAMGRTFGLKYVAANYGLLYTSQIISGVLSATVSSTLISHIGYFGLLFIVSGFSCIGFLSTLIYRAKNYVYIIKFH